MSYEKKYQVTGISLDTMQAYLDEYRAGGNTGTTIADMYRMSGALDYMDIMIEISQRLNYIELADKLNNKPASKYHGSIGALLRLKDIAIG